MECSDFSFQISEYVDERLDLASKKAVEQHLKVCPECRKMYDDMLELKDLFRVKSYQRPESEYFEHLQSNIKKRLLAHDIITLREEILRFVVTPSWAMTAVLAIALMTSLSFNFLHIASEHKTPSIAQSDITPNSSDSHTVYYARSTNNGTQSVSSAPQQTTATSDLRGLVHSASSISNQARDTFILRPIRVRDISQQERTRIYQ